MKYRIIIVSLIMISNISWSQKKFQINGAARGYFFANELNLDEELDSITTRKANYGHTLADFGVSVFPNKQTEVIGMFRIRNELGGFWGGGVSFNVRQLTLKGVAGNKVRYEVGDVDVSMTPYTLWNFREEGVINESDVFAMRRDVVYYDMFYNDENTWRMQGAKTSFGLNFNKGIKAIDFSGFVTRQRAAANNDPERLYGGGTMNIKQSGNLSLALNSVNMIDLKETIPDSIQFKNNVHTLTFDYDRDLNDNLMFGLNGEAGISNTEYINYEDPVVPEKRNDWFVDFSSSLTLNKDLTFSLGYKDVGADFLSPGAQTKRINYARFPGLYQQITNSAIGRPASYTDFISGNTENSIRISEELMDYNAAYSNSNPYGLATPNRRVVYLNLERSDSVEFRSSFLRTAYLSETRGTGTEQMKKFFLIEAGSDVYLNDFIGWENDLKLDLGLRFESTSRGGEVFEQVDLASTLIDLGLTIEFAENLDLLVGAKIWSAKGNALVDERNRYNVIDDFQAVDIDFKENTIAGGLRYRFSEQSTLSAQYQTFNMQHSAENQVNYGISQFTFLYSLFF